VLTDQEQEVREVMEVKVKVDLAITLELLEEVMQVMGLEEVLQEVEEVEDMVEEVEDMVEDSVLPVLVEMDLAQRQVRVLLLVEMEVMVM